MLENKKSNENNMNQEIDIKEFISAEEELISLKKQYGINEEPPFWKKAMDYFIKRSDKRNMVKIDKKKYCITALLGGWLGIHQFMVGKKGLGIIYLLTSFTGFSFAMSVLDIWYALFLKTDETNLIEI